LRPVGRAPRHSGLSLVVGVFSVPRYSAAAARRAERIKRRIKLRKRERCYVAERRGAPTGEGGGGAPELGVVSFNGILSRAR